MYCKGKKDRYCFFPSLSHCIILQNKNNRIKSFKKVKIPIEGKCHFTSSTFFWNANLWGLKQCSKSLFFHISTPKQGQILNFLDKSEKSNMEALFKTEKKICRVFFMQSKVQSHMKAKSVRKSVLPTCCFLQTRL